MANYTQGKGAVLISLLTVASIRAANKRFHFCRHLNHCFVNSRSLHVHCILLYLIHVCSEWCHPKLEQSSQLTQSVTNAEPLPKPSLPQRPTVKKERCTLFSSHFCYNTNAKILDLKPPLIIKKRINLMETHYIFYID